MYNTSFRTIIAYFVVTLFNLINLNYIYASTQSSLTNPKKTIAKFNCEKISDPILNNNTVLDLLVKESGLALDQFMENDKKTLIAFSIKYRAKVKRANKAQEEIIEQYGLFRSLNHNVQSYMLAHTNSDNNIKINYDPNNPIAIEFIVNDEIISAPVLLTNTIDQSWKKSIKK